MVVNPEGEARTWGMLCHLSALSQFIGLPLGHLLGPLIVWLIKKDQYPFVDDQGKEALNFQVSMTIWLAVSAVAAFLTCGIGFGLVVAVAIVQTIFTIIGAVQASNGVYYRYPLSFRFLQ